MKKQFFWLILLLSACQHGHDHKVGGGDFYVHFADPSDENLAVEIAKYWKDQGFVVDKKQDLKLTHKGRDYTLKLIANQPVDSTGLPYVEELLLHGLRDSLHNFLCDSCNLTLELCDQKFKPYYRIE